MVNEQFGSSLSNCMLDKCPVETLELVARHLSKCGRGCVLLSLMFPCNISYCNCS